MNAIPINVSAQDMPRPGEVYQVHAGGGGLLGAIVGAIAGGPIGAIAGWVVGKAVVPGEANFYKVGPNMEAIPCDSMGRTSHEEMQHLFKK